MALQVWLPLNKKIVNAGLGNVNVINNGVTISDSGILGKCGSFTTSQYIEITNVPFSKLNNCSVSFWIKLNASENEWLLVSGQNAQCYILAWRSETFHDGNFYHGGSASVSKIYVDGVESNKPIKDGNWHHYCAVGTNLSTWTKFYLNNYSATPSYNFTGLLNDFRIYDVALADEDVKRIYSNGIRTLQIRLPFNYNIKNIGLQKNAIVSTPSITPSYIAGPSDSNAALSFNGSTYWTSQNINLDDDVTICCWSKTGTNGKMTWVLESDACIYLNIFENSMYILNIGDGNDNPFKTDSNINIPAIHDNSWRHFAVTFGQGISKLYIDGIYIGKAATYRSPKTTNKPIKIGGGFNGTHTYDWNGGISDFRVYNHCLSEDDIKRIYNSMSVSYEIPDTYGIINFLKFLPGQYINTQLAISANTVSLTKADIYYEANGSGRDLMGWDSSSVGYWGVTANGTWEKATASDPSITNLNHITYNKSSAKQGTYQIGALNGSYSVRTKYIGHFEISVSNVIRRDMFPCYRKSDMKYGMYDTITKTFYTNNGSGGDFTGI